MLLLCFFKAKNKDAIILNTWLNFTLVYTNPHVIVSISLTADQMNLCGACERTTHDHVCGIST